MFQVSQSAASFYRNELDLCDGDSIRLFVQYGGSHTGGFKLGVIRDSPFETDIQQKVDGITFFSRPDDSWYVSQLKIDYDHSNNDIKWFYRH